MKSDELKSALDGLDEIILIKGPRSRIMWGNRVFREMYGMTEEQMGGIVDVDESLQYVMDDRSVFATGEPMHVEEPVVGVDGARFELETSKYRWPGGTIGISRFAGTNTARTPRVDALTKVLIVEDNPGDVMLTRKSLERTGFEIEFVICTDGDEAVDYLRSCDIASLPALVLLDINIPKRSGLDVLIDIKTTPATRFIPVVMLTSSNREIDIKAALSAHANSYIVKPKDVGRMREVARKVVDFWLDAVELVTK